MYIVVQYRNFTQNSSKEVAPERTGTSPPSQTLPSSRSVIQVLYPPSYLGIPSPFPDPPPYPAQEHNAEVSLSTVAGTRSRFDPLSEDPSLTGVPSQGRVPSVEPNPPIIGCGDAMEETEPLPAYSRFDQRRPRFPVASDVLGPYPPLSGLR